MDLSILVVTYNTKDLVGKCIQSVRSYNGNYQIEIIIVDNNSEDGTSEFIREIFPNVKLIKNMFNYGFAVGMNQAYKLALGRYVMTFNPDAEINNSSIDAAIGFLDTNPDTGLLGMLTEDTLGTVEIPFHEFNLIGQIETIRLFSRKSKLPERITKEVIQVEWIWGTSIFARKAELGDEFFNEDNFLFWEEYWLAKKIKSQGLKINILLKHKMLHHISASFKSDFQKLEMVRTLGDVNGHTAKVDKFGAFKTYFSYLIKTFDHLAMFLILNLLRLFKTKNVQERRLSIINHKAHFKAYFQLFIFGSSFQARYQLFAIKALNKGSMPVYPPLTVD